MANRSLTTKIHSALLVAVGWLQHTRCPRFRRGTFGYGTTTSPIQRGKAEVRSFHVNARWYTQTSQMHMLCSACSKATFILVHKVVSKTKKNKLRNEDSIGSLIGTRFSDRGTWLITTSINNALRTLLLKEMFNPGITSMRVFRITKQHLELQFRLAAITRFLVQLTAIVNQKRLWYTRVPYKHYTLTTQNYISN
jgi:hypothetical protein